MPQTAEEKPFFDCGLRIAERGPARQRRSRFNTSVTLQVQDMGNTWHLKLLRSRDALERPRTDGAKIRILPKSDHMIEFSRPVSRLLHQTENRLQMEGEVSAKRARRHGGGESSTA